MTIAARLLDDGPPLPFGWLSPTEAAFLAELARAKTVLEVGAFLGRSTIVLARAAALVVSIDHHRGSAEHQVGGKYAQTQTNGIVDTAGSFLRNLDVAGVRDRVVPFVGSIETAGTLLAAERFDLVFLDGDHSHAATLAAGAIAFRLAKRNGIVAFHDFGTIDFPGVAQAVGRLAETFGAREVGRGGSIVALRRT
jgi:predicted O-methyltransferase YrrM